MFRPKIFPEEWTFKKVRSIKRIKTFPDEYSLINIKSIMNLENCDFVIPNAIVDTGKN